MSAEEWQQIRRLFDAVCECPPDEWRPRLEALTSDPDLRERTLRLLQAQTVELRRAAAPLDRLLAQAVEPELQPGDCLGPWRLTRRLASGGMGTVFLAQRADDLYQQQVAVKLLHGLPDPRVAELLAAERRILAGLEHPNVARLYDGGATPSGQPYLVMEYVDGQPLDRYCAQRSPDLGARLRLFLRICRAVQAAHEKLVIHCDLKPANVLVKDDGEPMLLDFGVARLLDGVAQAERAGFCTPAYASPELVAGQPVGVSGDVFSLGVMLVEMLADRRVRREPGDSEKPVPRPSQWARPPVPWRRRLAGDLDAIAAMACALDPARRYPSVAALAGDIELYLAHRPVRARGGGRLYRIGRGLRRHWHAAAVAALVVVMATGFVWRLVEARAVAEHEAAVARQVSDFLVSSFEAADPRKRGDPTREATAREVLDAGAARIDRELADAPAQLARLKAVLGKAYQHMGQPQQAEALLGQAVEALLDPQVDRPVQAAEVLADLAVELSNRGRGEEAEAAARRALALLEGRGAPAARAHALNGLGLALMTRQRHAESEAAFNESLALRRQLPHADAWSGAVTVQHNLGLLHRNRGDYAAAEALLREVLEVRRRTAPSSPQHQVTLQALATVLVQQGRLEEAVALNREGLALSRALFGPDSSSTGSAHAELAGLYQDLGEYGEAADHYALALDITGRVEGEESISYAIYLNNFATLEESRGDLAHAEQLYRRSLDIRRQRLGTDAPASLRAESNLGRLLMRAGRRGEARALMARPLAVWSDTLEPDAPDLRISRLGFVEWHMRGGDLAQARRLLAELPPEGWSAGLARRHLQLQAELAHREDPASAVGAWRALVEAGVELYGIDSVPVARWRIPYAEALLAGGDPGAAGAQFARAAPRLRAQLAPGAEDLARMQRLDGELERARRAAAGPGLASNETAGAVR